MNKNRFDIEYKQWLQQLDVGDENAIWNEIQDELDFVETWENISGQLDKVKPARAKVIPMRFLKFTAAAAAVILLLFLPVKYFFEQVIRPEVVAEQINEGDQQVTIQPEETTPVKTEQTNKNSTGIAETLVPHVNRSSGTFLIGASKTDQAALTGINDSEDSGLITKKIIFERIPMYSFNLDHLLASEDALLPNATAGQNLSFSGSRELIGSVFRVVELGLVYGYKNTWLLNHETFNGLDPDRLGITRLTFHQEIGASSTLELYNRHLVGLEFLWKSETGQNYQQYIDASFVERNIELDYRKFQVFYIYPPARFPGQLLFGGYAAKLNLAQEKQGEAVIRVDDVYRKMDYGLIAGYQLNVSLSNNLFIHPGLRLNYNLLNIFEGDDVSPGRFKKTRNFSASFIVNLSYRFSD